MPQALDFLSSLGPDSALPPGFDPGAFIHNNLDLLGSPDPRVRDDLFYGSANAWIQAGLVPAVQLGAILETVCGGDFLFAGIEDDPGQSVFRRSFSVLILASVVEHDNRAGLLDSQARARALEALLSYARRENNTEGYLELGGWAHSVAHTADALGAYLSVVEPGSKAATASLAALAELLFKRPGRYCHEEPRRLALALGEYLGQGEAGGREAAAHEGLAFLEGLGSDPRVDRSRQGMAGYYRRINLLDFLESLFFCLPKDSEPRLVAGLGAEIARLLRPRP